MLVTCLQALQAQRCMQANRCSRPQATWPDGLLAQVLGHPLRSCSHFSGTSTCHLLHTTNSSALLHCQP